MRAVDLDWRVTENTGKRAGEMRSGMALSRALFGRFSRFQIVEHWQRPMAGKPQPSLYLLHDAERVTDAQVRAGMRSPVIARSENPQKLIDYALELERGEVA